MSSPARVVVAPRPSRSRSCTPSSSSRARMCSETVGWVRKSASAAREKLPSSATFAKISRRRRSIRRSREWEGLSVAGAAAAATAAARYHGRGRLHRPDGLQTEDRQLAHDLSAGAGGACHRRRGAGDVLLELLLALLAAILVDRHALFTASLHVALDELLSVLLQDVVDLVEELVDVFLDLLALLGQLGARGGSVTTAFCGLCRPGLFLLLLCHLALHGATSRVAKSERSLLEPS